MAINLVSGLDVDLDSGWSWLPPNLLDLIFANLVSVSDSIGFSAVCTPWRRLAVENLSRKLVKNQIPLLMVPTKDNDKDHRSLYSVTHQKLYEKCMLPVPYNVKCCGSSHGWLVTIDDARVVSLLNPFTSRVMHLPLLKRLGDSEDGEDDDMQEEEEYEEYDEYDEYYEYYEYDEDEEDEEEIGYGSSKYGLYKAVLSADPDSNPDDFVVMAIYGRMKRLAFIKSGDEDWTYLEKEANFHNIMLFNFVDLLHREDEGRFYALRSRGEVLSFEIDTSLTVGPEVKIVSQVCDNLTHAFKLYLVECPEPKDLLLVERTLCPESMITRGFKVYRRGDSGGRKEWIQVGSLGDGALFLGDTYSSCALASDFPGCSSNSIYFTHDCFHNYDFPREPRDMGVFHLEDGSFEQHYQLDGSQTHMQPPIWILPTFK